MDMNRKGFTLFTALVSFVLILLTAMIVQTMIKAERDRTEVISNIEEQAEMQAMADLTRAEALQTFNYSLRKTIEGFFDTPGNTIEIYPQDHNFGELKQAFANQFFGAGVRDSFIWQIRTGLVKSMPGIKYIGPYEISLEQTDETTLNNALKELFKKSVESGNFFEVVECENGDPQDCLGTFYLNLRVDELDDETYESFPQIKVYNARNERVLQESIFPRGKIKIYVPIRLFKAIAEARALALEFEKEEDNCSDDKCWKTNYGLLSPRIHNEIEEMKLGICDPGYCSVRTNPYTPPETKNMNDHPCPNTSLHFGSTNWGTTAESRIQVNCTSDLRDRGICTYAQYNAENTDPLNNFILVYNPSRMQDASNQSNKISLLAGLRLCSLAKLNYAEKVYLDPLIDGERDGFILGQDDSEPYHCALTTNGPIISFKVTSVTRNSVEVIQKGFGDVRTHSSPNPEYNANLDYSSPSSDCPLTYPKTDFGRYGIGINSEDRIEQKTVEGQKCNFFLDSGEPFSDALNTHYATCSEVQKVEVGLTFRETDKNYIINKNIEPTYVVELIDNKFTPTDDDVHFHQNQQYKIDYSNCGLSALVGNDCSESHWKCESWKKRDGEGMRPSETGGCKVPGS